MLARWRHHFPAVELLEQIVEVEGNQIDELVLQGFGLRGRDALAHRFFGPFDVASTLFGDRLDVGGGIIGHLVRHLLAHLAAADCNRVGRADVGAGRHSRDVCRQRNESPG